MIRVYMGRLTWRQSYVYVTRQAFDKAKHAQQSSIYRKELENEARAERRSLNYG